MWILTPRGFYSVVEHREHPGLVIVRARARADLENLDDLWCELQEGRTVRPLDIEQTPKADYPYRTQVAKSEWASMTAAMAREIDYPNFKDAVKKVNADRATFVYMAVWSALRRIEQEEFDWDADEPVDHQLNIDDPLDLWDDPTSG